MLISRSSNINRRYLFSSENSVLSQESLSKFFVVLRSSDCHVSILLTNFRNILLSSPSILLIEFSRLKLCEVRSELFSLPVSCVNKHNIEFRPVSEQELTLKIIKH